MEEKNETVTENKSEKKEVVYTKNEKYGQDTDKAVRVLLLGGNAHHGSGAGSGDFLSYWVRSDFIATVGFFTTVKLD